MADQLIHVEESAIIDAPPVTLYELLRDYKEGHPSILPEPYFKSVNVTNGGVGAGTEFDVTMNVMGTKPTYHMIVTEPEPGRILMESDDVSGVTTQFIVDAADEGKSHLTISTYSRLSKGLAGFIQRLTMPPIMRRIYKQELQKINTHFKA